MPNSVPNLFQNRTGSIPLADLDANFDSLQSLTSNSGASKIGVYDGAAHFTGDNVEAVLAELWTYADNSRDRTNHIGTQSYTSLSNYNLLPIDLASNPVTGTIAQFNTALSDADFATLAGSETLTNKTINLTNNTVTGTTAEFNTALSDGDFATLAGTETLTNKRINPRVSALTAGANIASNIDNFDIGWVVITQNSTIDNPTGTPVNGQKVTYRVKQGGTGTWTLGWGAAFRFSGGTAPTMTATADKTDYFEFSYNVQDSKWDLTNFAQNL